MFGTIKRSLRSLLHPVTTGAPAAAPVAQLPHKVGTQPQLRLELGNGEGLPSVADLRESLVNSDPVPTPAVSIYTLFTAAGAFRYAQLFRFNELSIRNLLHRKGILAVIKNCERSDFMAIPFERRKLVFALLKQETARYNGTAKRQATTSAGKRGSPLPQLRFPTPQDAAAYRQLLQQAMRTVADHVYQR